MVDYSFKMVAKKAFLYELQCFFVYPNWDLQREIEDRQGDQSLFPPEEVLLFLQDALAALTFLQTRRMVHGNLRPKYFSLRSADKPY